jgi:APA family basic amino acid/polyamine antiporter
MTRLSNRAATNSAPASMARSLASPAWILAVWIAMGAMAACGALCYAELASRFPEAGGSYVYLREAFGSRVAFLYGWKCFLVMDPGLTAALAVGMTGYVGYLVALPAWAPPLVAIATIVLLATANVLGLKLGAAVARLLTALKVGALAAIALWGFASGNGDWSHFVPFAARPEAAGPLPSALAGAFVAAFFSFGGWWSISKLGGEVRDPARTFPRAMIGGLAIVTLAYILTSAVFIYLVPISSVTSDDAFAAVAGEALFGRAGGTIFAGVVVVSVLGSLAAFVVSAPRVYYAMARDGLFPHAVARLHPRFGTPSRAIALQAVLASVVAALGTFDQILAFFIFVTVLFIGLTVAALFRFRRRAPEAPFLAPGFPATAIVFLALIAVLALMLLAGSPKQALVGAAVVALGIPVHALIKKNSRG